MNGKMVRLLELFAQAISYYIEQVYIMDWPQSGDEAKHMVVYDAYGKSMLLYNQQLIAILSPHDCFLACLPACRGLQQPTA